MDPALDLLARHLADQRRLGRQRLQLSESAREKLRRLGSPQASQAVAPAQPSSAQASTVDPTDPADLQPSTTTPTQAASLAYAQAPDLETLRALLAADPALTQLPSLREQLVFGVGHPQAPLVLVGEAPGQEEERQQEPFVGAAGQLLNRILQAMQLSREQIYISNILKFRPRIGSQPDQGSANRKPTADEIQRFRPILQRELELIRPRAIIALGAAAHHGLLQHDLPVGQARGQSRPLPGLDIPVITTYHPSYLLRLQGSQGEQAAKRLVWEDMLLALEIAQLPITEKMRGFFLPR